MKTILVIFTAMFSVLFTKAQEIEIAKEHDLVGDARSAGMAGATGAIGGSFASSLANPAGLTFCKNEFTLTPFIKMNRSVSLLHGNASADEKWNQGIGNMSFVYGLNQKRTNKKAAWSNIKIGGGFVRTADFNERLLAEGINKKNSLVDSYLEYANFKEGIRPENLDPMGAALAFQTMLIDTLPRNFWSDTVNYFRFPKGDLLQSFERVRSGKGQSLVINFTAKYGKKLSLGAAIKRQTIAFEERIVYREADNSADEIPYFNSFTYERNRLISGRGFGLKGGAIWEATKSFALGISAETPMFMNIGEVEMASMKSDFADRELEAESPEMTRVYQMTSPSKVTASIAISNPKKTFVLGADYEALDYRSLRVRTPDIAFDQNREIATMLKPTANLRLGLEAKIKKVALRAGVAANGNPLVGNPFMKMKWEPENFASAMKNNIKAFERTSVAAGFGLADVFRQRGVSQKKGAEYYLDCSFIATKSNNPPLWLYQLKAGESPQVVGASISRMTVVTLGVRF